MNSQARKEAMRFLAQGDFRVVFGWINKTTVGQIDFCANTITLNIELMVYAVWVHEMSHKLHPNYSEKRIEAMERRKVKRTPVKVIRETAQKLLTTSVWEDK